MRLLHAQLDSKSWIRRSDGAGRGGPPRRFQICTLSKEMSPLGDTKSRIELARRVFGQAQRGWFLPNYFLALLVIAENRAQIGSKLVVSPQLHELAKWRPSFIPSRWIARILAHLPRLSDTRHQSARHSLSSLRSKISGALLFRLDFSSTCVRPRTYLRNSVRDYIIVAPTLANSSN